MLSEVVTTFSTVFKGTPCGRARGPASVGSEYERGSRRKGVSKRRETRCRGRVDAGALAAGGRQPGPLPLALRAPARAAAATRSAPHRPAGGPRRYVPGDRADKSNRAVLPRQAILSPRKLPVKGAPAARPSAALRADP